MNTFFRFFYEFVSIFFEGIAEVFKGIGKGFGKMFGINEYSKVINSYKDHFTGGDWVFVVLSIVILLALLGLIIFLIVMFIKKMIRRASANVSKDELLEEVANLNDQVVKLMKEKDELMAMKVSQLGLKPGEEGEETSEPEEEIGETGIRFPKLTMLDEKFGKLTPKKYENNYTLPGLIDDFRCFAASKLHLYYDPVLLRPFIAGLACGKLIILQGISGTGKTSLAYAWGKFVKKDSCVSSVEPSWRDKSDFLGYFNEFSKKFNETKALGEIYETGFDDDIHTIILDEMNLARVEYYFAEMLSILEMPNRSEWIIEIVASPWPNDPKHIIEGRLRIPPNTWYIGTINNDDSTFMVTDKVYDRAMPIDINDKGQVFEAIDTPPMDINFSYLDGLFMKAREEHPVSQANWDKINAMDDYVIAHFRVAFGNRIVSHLGKFVSAYVACGGDEVAGIDYFIAKKILRKFEQLNIAYIKDEIDGFVTFLDKTFGKGAMKECIEYVLRLKKLG